MITKVTNLVREVVEEHYHLDIKQPNRRRAYVEARAMYYKLLKDNFRYSYAAIGETMEKNHATVLHSCRQMDDWIQYDKEIELAYHDLTKKIRRAIDVDIELLKASETLEGFYEEKYFKLQHEYTQLKELLEEYKTAKVLRDENTKLRTQNGYLKHRLSIYQPQLVESGKFDV